MPLEIVRNDISNMKTELVFILARRGSVSGLEPDTIGGFNSMLDKQKKKSGEAFASTSLFDGESTVIHDRVALDKASSLTEGDHCVQGRTALPDTVGSTIHFIGTVHKYASHKDVPYKTLFIITTAGYENASRTYTYKRVCAYAHTLF